MRLAPLSHAQLLRRERRKTEDRLRGHSAARGYDRRHRDARVAFLRDHPFCRRCLEAGREVAATVLDHIIPHRGDRRLLRDRGNWEALCKTCHDRKTRLEDGGCGHG